MERLNFIYSVLCGIIETINRNFYLICVMLDERNTPRSKGQKKRLETVVLPEEIPVAEHLENARTDLISNGYAYVESKWDQGKNAFMFSDQAKNLFPLNLRANKKLKTMNLKTRGVRKTANETQTTLPTRVLIYDANRITSEEEIKRLTGSPSEYF